MNSVPEKLSLPSLQSKMKCDPEGYESELVLLYSQFKSSVELLKQQTSLQFSSFGGIGCDPSVAKDLSDRAMFLAHVTPFFPKHLMEFPKQLADFLNSSASSLPSSLRCHTTQALMLLINRKMVDIEENLMLFMKLQTLGDRALRKLACSHVIQSIRKMNHKHKNELKNRALQKILFTMLQQEDEANAMRSLITLCELYQRKVWFDERTANAISIAVFHSSPRIMIAALSFLLNYENIDGEDDGDEKSGDDDAVSQTSQTVLSKELSRQVRRKILASKKKKKAKLQRASRSIKRRLRSSLEKSSSSYSPLDHLKDAQGFVEKLFSRLHACNERFEVKMMMLRVIARTIELHRLILLNFYPFLQKYVQPHQRDIKNLLAAAIQACHDKVPPDAVEPLFKQIVNQFVHDHSRTEAIVVGLNAASHICERMPLLMTEDLLQDLALYKKSREKAVSGAARSLIASFQLICPSFLVKKDRGRPTNPKARPKAYGEVLVACDIPGIELLQQDDGGNSDGGYGDCNGNDAGDDYSEPIASGSSDDLDQMVDSSDGENQISCDVDSVAEFDFNNYTDDDESGSDSREMKLEIDEEDEEDSDKEQDANHNKESISDEIVETGSMDAGTTSRYFMQKKRKRSDFDQQLLTSDSSLRALKKLSGKVVGKPLGSTDGILSNEDFQRIKKLQAKNEAKDALTQHGLLRNGSTYKISNTEELSTKRVNPAMFEVHIRKKLSKDEKLALVRAGREDRGKYQARAAVKQKKTGGSSNRQKEHKKAMPLAAKRAKVAKTLVDKRKKNQHSGKQFRGRKAWK